MCAPFLNRAIGDFAQKAGGDERQGGLMVGVDRIRGVPLVTDFSVVWVGCTLTDTWGRARSGGPAGGLGWGEGPAEGPRGLTVGSGGRELVYLTPGSFCSALPGGIGHHGLGSPSPLGATLG